MFASPVTRLIDSGKEHAAGGSCGPGGMGRKGYYVRTGCGVAAAVEALVEQARMFGRRWLARRSSRQSTHGRLLSTAIRPGMGGPMLMRMSALPPACLERARAGMAQPLAGGRFAGCGHGDVLTARGAPQ